METIHGARKWTWVYVVDSIILELLLGEEDAEDLRIIKFYQKGRKETAVDKVTMLATFKLRQVGIKLRTKKTMPAAIIEAQRQKTLKTVKLYTGFVFMKRVKWLEGEEVQLRYMRDFRHVQLPWYLVLNYYQERLSAHLNNIRQDGVIDYVDTGEEVDCVLNVKLLEKTTQRAIYMNINMRPMNEGALHTHLLRTEYGEPIPSDPDGKRITNCLPDTQGTK